MREGLSLLAGVVVGTVAILALFTVNVGPFAFALGTPVPGSMAGLACTPGQCMNVSIGFTGRASIDPATLRLSIVPSDPSVVVNATPGAPLNLTFFITAIPHWLGNLGKGNYTDTFEANVADPNGQLVGYGGPTTIKPGAILCLKGAHSPTSEEYQLTFSYEGSVATVSVTFA